MQVWVSYPLEFRSSLWRAAALDLHTTLNFPAIAAVTLKTHGRSLTSTFHIQTQPFSSKPFENWCRCTSDETGYQNSLGYVADSQTELDEDDDVDVVVVDDDEVVINMTKLGKRWRRIESSIRINARLETVWGILTDYERLSEFIPGLAVSRLLEQRDSYARLFQIGEQNLALGLKFNAKAVLDCYEKDLESLSSSRKRDIEFKMVEGDFEIFEGKWSIEEHDTETTEGSQIGDFMEGQEFQTILSYVLEVKPKLWLPVRLVEGRLCREIKINLSCLRKEAHLKLASSCS